MKINWLIVNWPMSGRNWEDISCWKVKSCKMNTMWKGKKLEKLLYARKWCQKLYTILFQVTFPELKELPQIPHIFMWVRWFRNCKDNELFSAIRQPGTIPTFSVITKHFYLVPPKYSSPWIRFLDSGHSLDLEHKTPATELGW